MSKNLRTLASAIVLATQISLCGCSSGSMPNADGVTSRELVVNGSAAEAASVLAAREALNRALHNRDVAVFASYWMPEMQAIVGGDGGMHIGRGSNVEAYKSMFADPTFVSGLRTPERIDVGVSSDGVNQAAESGGWLWRFLRNGTQVDIGGRYLVFWRKTESGWKILQETYVTTACPDAQLCSAPSR